MECRPNWSVKQLLLLCTYLHIFTYCRAGEKLALLSATLRTYQKAACDTDQILVACPRGTSISIEFAQYNNYIDKDGISIEQLCPHPNATNSNNSAQLQLQLRAKAKHLLRGSIFGSSSQKVPALRQVANNNANVSYNKKSTNQTNISATSSSIRATTTDTATATTTTTTISPKQLAENCMWPNALQYSLLQTVVEACQKKKHCRFSGSAPYYSIGSSGVGDTSGTSSYHTSSSSSSNATKFAYFNASISANINTTTDATSTTSSSSSHDSSNIQQNTGNMQPCPKQRKIVEIAYKCRPYEFRSKVACHNDVAQLECNPYSRIAVYSASFGRTEYESIQCPQPQGVREETCLAAYATETVMQICHGRRRCNLAADANTFGTPCRPNSRMYLKVVYTCVPKQVLKDRYESEIESDELESDHNDLNDLYDDELSYKESEAIPKLYSNTTATADTILTKSNGNNGEVNSSFVFDSDTDGVAGVGGGGINPVMTHSADLSLEDDRERLYLYLLICGSASIIISIVLIAARLLLQKREHTTTETHSPASIKVTQASSASGLGFNDGISEIDADIDLTTPIPMPVASLTTNENFVTYGAKNGGNTTSLYESLATPSSLLQAHNNSTSSSITAPNSVLIPNPLVFGHRSSPDIIGISSNAFVATSNAAVGATTATADDKQITALEGLLAPTLVIGSGNTPIVDTINVSCDARVVGTLATLPLSTITQYTTAPSLRAGYIINAEAVLATNNVPTLIRNTQLSPIATTTSPAPSPQPPAAAGEQSTTATTLGRTSNAIFASQLFQQQQHQSQCTAQMPTAASNHQLPAAAMAATLRRNKALEAQHQQQQQQQQQQRNVSYDGTAPRTLSTGVPVNSKFYYG